MAITLGTTNTVAYSARMQFNKVSDGLSEVYKKISTGQKINSAGDDAAGLVISQNMEAKIAGSKQAMKNVQTAQSFLQIAEDGMVSISDHFQRINDLLTNMANDTNSIESRTAAIREVIERLEEIDRLADSTNFSGMNMLDGSVDSIIVQVTSDTEKSISTLDISKALTDCHVQKFNAELPGVLNPEAKINTNDDIISPKTYNEDQYKILTRTDSSGGEPETTVYVLKKGNNGEYYYTNPEADGSYKKYVEPTEGDITDTLTDVTDGYIVEDEDGKKTYLVSDGKQNPTYYEIGKKCVVGTDDTYEIGENLLTAYAPDNESFRGYMGTIQAAISEIATRRGLLGAYENRMISSYDSLAIRIESLESAKIPYTDTDIAEETTKLAQKQILEQINVAILQQANANQQMALSLLG